MMSTRTDFDWIYTDEPHATRRVEMLKKHPELKQLFRLDPSFPYVITAMVFTQLYIAYWLRDQDWTLFFLMTYFAGGVMNHALLSAIHEIAHNLGFGIAHPVANKFLGIFANIPLALGIAVKFKDIHLEHHRYLGEDTLDWTLPCEMECRLFNTPATRAIWLLFQPAFQAYRQYMLYARKLSVLGKANILFCLCCSILIANYWSVKSFLYFALGMFICGSWHPTAGRYVQEHGLYKEGQDTYSYYGPLNLVMFNIGYHVEHHDLPYVPGRYLPLVRKIAPEFYQDLYSHTSWVRVLLDFVINPRMGLLARIKRPKAHELKTSYDDTSIGEYCEMVSAMSFLKPGFH